MVFSITTISAVGMVEEVAIMIAAVVVAIGVMYAASGPIAGFVKRNPTTKMLALAFLLLIGVALIADGLGFHIPRGYIYFAMAFAAIVEVFNVVARRRRRKVS
jgi:predicted tellurium resistance membrane protein TerC